MADSERHTRSSSESDSEYTDELPNASRRAVAHLFGRKPQTRQILTWKTAAAITMAILGLCLSFTMGRRSITSPPLQAPQKYYDLVGINAQRDSFQFANGTRWSKDASVKVVAVVFFGRRQFVDVLDCYLRRNLVSNGGILDEVHFIVHTDVEDDKSWLRSLVKAPQVQGYYRLMEEDTDKPGWSQWGSYSELYRDYMTDPDTIYFKLDDDIMFIDDEAFVEVLKTVLEHPEAHVSPQKCCNFCMQR